MATIIVQSENDKSMTVELTQNDEGDIFGECAKGMWCHRPDRLTGGWSNWNAAIYAATLHVEVDHE